MKGIKIQSVSERGNAALLRNQKDTREAKFLQRQQMNLAYKVVFNKEEPYYSLSLFGRSKYLTTALTLPIAIDMMTANNAAQDIDYVITEVEE